MRRKGGWTLRNLLVGDIFVEFFTRKNTINCHNPISRHNKQITSKLKALNLTNEEEEAKVRIKHFRNERAGDKRALSVQKEA